MTLAGTYTRITKTALALFFRLLPSSAPYSRSHARLKERMTVPKPFAEWRKRNQAKTLQPAYAQTCENITVQRAKRFRIMFLHLIFSAQGACGVAGVHRGLARALPKWHVQSCGAKTSSISRPTKPDLSSLTRSLSEECPLGLLALRIA